VRYDYKVVCFDIFIQSKPIKIKNFINLTNAVKFCRLANNFNPKLYHSQNGIDWKEIKIK
jgi:hypothetical protein